VNDPFFFGGVLDVFARYNLAVWPAQWIFLAMALGGIVLALPKTKDFSRSISLVLMILWLWSGLVYQLIFFRAINCEEVRGSWSRLVYSTKPLSGVVMRV